MNDFSDANNVPVITEQQGFVLRKALEESTWNGCGSLPESLHKIFMQTGLAKKVNGSIRLQYALKPFDIEHPDGKKDRWWIASDLEQSLVSGPLPKDYVLGIGQATLSLAHFISRHPRKLSLDLGTGCGILAMLMTLFSTKVIATDISTRALGFATFNRTLAQIDPQRLELMQGSFFDPVKDYRFDLIVSNPPFVITPQELRAKGHYEYRDAQMEGDEVLKVLLEQSAKHLLPDGLIQMLANWEIKEENIKQDEKRAKLRQWAKNVELDLWVTQRGTLNGQEYAQMWLKDSGGNLNKDFDPQDIINIYQQDFSSREVASVAFGYIAGRIKKRALPFYLMQESEQGSQAPQAKQVDTVFSVADFLAGKNQSELGKYRYECSLSLRESRIYRPGSTDILEIWLIDEAKAFKASVSPQIAAVIGACDGEYSLHQIIVAVQGLMESQDLETEFFQVLEKLLYAGVLLPASVLNT